MPPVDSLSTFQDLSMHMNYVFICFAGEKLKSNISKFVVSVWMFVVLILTSSYTANLSSLLTAKQIRLLKDDYIGYSSSMIQNQTENNMNFMDHRPKYYRSAEEYDDSLSRGSKNGGVAAIIDEMPYVQLFLGHYPHDYGMIKSTMITNGFGFVFQKGSPLVHDVSRAIAGLRENGKLQEMEKKWFASQSSVVTPQDERDETSTLRIGSFYGLFLVSGISKAIAILLFTFFLLRERLGIESYVRRVFAVGKLAFILRHLFPRRATTINGLEAR